MEAHIPTAVVLGGFLRITEPDDALKVFDLGAFGKAILQRSRPLPKDQYNLARCRKAKNKPTASDAELIHSSTLQLTLEEGFYLAFETYSIQIQIDDKVLSSDGAWERFCLSKKNFSYYYAAYRHFRRIGWIPKSGVKYGVDYILYPSSTMLLGRKHVHAPYSVIVRYPSDCEADPVHGPQWSPDMSGFVLQSASRLACQVRASPAPPRSDGGACSRRRTGRPPRAGRQAVHDRLRL